VFRLAVCICALLLAQPAFAEPLQTVAEKTDYKSTSRYADVIAFCEAIAKRDTAKLEYFGTSQEGRKLPLLIISDLNIPTPEEAKQAGKLVVMAFANIHAGEVDGKEALLALARDLTDKKNHPLLKDLVILLVPIFNADGNELIDPKNRPGDNGPTNGAGTRENAQGLDLNRDFVKLDSPEVRALVKLFNTWNPALVIDCHTTNGSKHRYALTYDGPRYPSHDTEIAQWTNTTLFPEVAKKVKAATNYDIAPYGNFDKDRSRWESYPALPRFGVQYLALRGTIGVLSESYAHASFKDRVLATHAFVTACLEVAAEKRKSLAEAVATGVKRVPVKTYTEAFPDKLTIMGFEEVVKDGKRVVTDNPKDYSLAFHGKISMESTFKVPTMYLFPPTLTEVRENLQRHGIEVQELREDIDLGVQRFSITNLEREPRPYQKRTLITVGGMWVDREQRVPAGTLVVKTAQPLGKLAAYLLEVETEDGLTKWGFFTDHLKLNTDSPVMKTYGNAPLTLGPAPTLPENLVSNQPITEAMLLGGGGRFTFGLQGSPVTPGAWLDADHFLQTKDGKLWKADARTGHAELFTDPELIKKSLAAVKELNAAAAEKLSKSTFFRFNPDRTAFLFDVGGDLGLAYFDGRPAVRLTKSDGPREYVSFSPDGKRIAFVRNGNLYTVDVEKQEEKQLTADGGGEILNAKSDWVYEEEIFNRHGQAYWWSPDGKQIAFMRFDDSPVKRFSLLNLAVQRVQLEAYPYPKVGDPNPTVKLGVVAAAGGKPTFLDLTGYPSEDLLVARVGWMPDSKTVFAYLQNRTQTFLDFATWPTPDAKPRVLFKETTRAWVEDTGPPHFLPDGSFLFASERSGWKHLYHYSADGKLLGPVTSGEWEIHDVQRVDAKDVYFTAAYTSPTGTDLCRASIAEGKTELLTEKGKSHRVSLPPSGPLFIDRFTDPMTPTQAAVVDIGKGQVRKLDTNPVRERDQFKFGRYERVKIPMKDGFELEGAITYPPDFDRKKKYPVWVFTYAGPHAPTIHDEWGGGRILDNTLATNGIIVFRVDPRSASGKGAQSAWTCYKQLGVQELKDLEEAVAWLCQNPYADATRVGISGHSYGGFMAAFALTHSKTFSAGIASGPVTDWRLYDSIYTERYMLTPKENVDGYAKTSCVAAAKNVNGKLLIVHGMMDDNVHMQNSVQLADALQRAGKEFEMMFYPQARHGIGGAHYLKLQLEFIRRTMGVAK
jgi:dipeptidyl aminopeptidase/acylaminoacyl peptidase